jgi:hypothetical protein
VSGASNFLDPVEAVQDEVSRSKRVIASALDDLTQHHSWLESYHRDERRRAQRIRRREALEALALRRQRAAWMARRFALTSFVVMRAAALFLARNGAAFLAWTAPRAKALTLLALSEMSIALAWSWRASRVLAVRGFEAASTGFAWSVRASDALGVALRKRLAAGAAVLYAEAAIRAEPVLRPALKRASTGWTRTRFRSKRLASALQAQLSDGWARTRSRAPVLARNAVTATSQGCAWLAKQAVVISAQGRDQVSIAFGWTVRTSDELGAAFRKRLSSGAALLYAEAAPRVQSTLQPAFKKASARWTLTRHLATHLACTLEAQLSDSWSRMRSSAPIFMRNAAKAASETWSQAASRARNMWERHDPQHRALIVRRSTALVCIAPLRARLPVVRES